MFAAPSYPWPTIQEIVRPEFSTADKIASAMLASYSVKLYEIDEFFTNVVAGITKA